MRDPGRTSSQRELNLLRSKVAALEQLLEVQERTVVEQSQKLERTLAELRRSNEDLEQFAYVVSHDLKSPLRAVSAFAGFLAQDYAAVLDEEGREKLQILVDRAKWMTDMIDGILRYSCAGRDKGQPVRFDSREIVDHVIDGLAPPENIRVRIEGALPEIVFDRTQFGQVVQNLIGNGIKHLDKPEGEIVVSCRDAGRFWEYCVRDNGPGIAEEHHGRIFELFQTLKPPGRRRDTGIGLSVAKRIVERRGGSIRVESTPGEGSRFIFTVAKGFRGSPSAGPEDL